LFLSRRFLFYSFQWFDNKKSVNGHHKVQTLKHGLQAASIILSIITTSGIDPQLLNEDVISNIINFIHHHFSNHVIPCLSNNGHWTLHSTKYSKQEKKTPKKKKTKKLGNSEELQSNSKKTKCKTPSKDIQLKQYKKIYKYILVTIGDLSILLEKVQSLISHIPLEDSNLLAICDAALQSLTLNPSISIPNATTSTNVLQTGCIGLITMIVKRYPRHRGVIVEDLFPLFLKIPTCKRTLRTFDVNVNCCKSASKSRKQKKKSVLHSGTKVITALDSYPVCVQSEYKCIQPMTAMILYLIQACVEMPHPTDNDNMESSEREKTLLQSGLIGCKKMSRFFVHNLIHRCSKRGEEGGASDFRPLLSHLVEDLLMVQMNPEFPGAEFVLFALCERICCDLLSQCSDRKKQGLAAADGTYLTTIADTLGLICSDIISKLVEHKNNPFEFPDATKLEDIRKEENRCFCGRDREYDFQLDCDRCHSWFHGTCYGIAKNDLPSLWYCDECKLQLLIIEETRKLISHEYNPNEILGEGDKSHVMRILLLNYLSKQSRGTNSVFGGTARHCHLAKVIEEYEEARTKKSKENGIDEMEFEKMITYYLSLWDNVGFTHSKAEDTKSNAQTDFLSGVGNQKLMLALNASKSTLTLALPTLLGVLVKLMGDVGMISLRKLALKAIAPVVENDPSIMTRCDIFTAVVGRLQDNAISVRERAVNLVGLYVLKMPKEAEKFHCNLLSRLNDSGISVVSNLEGANILRDIWWFSYFFLPLIVKAETSCYDFPRSAN
jgi:cohesin loading factor subunit SCC2